MRMSTFSLTAYTYVCIFPNSLQACIHECIWHSQLQSSGAVWKSRWPSCAFRPNEPYGFCGRKSNIEPCFDTGHSLSLICHRHPRTWSSTSSSSRPAKSFPRAPFMTTVDLSVLTHSVRKWIGASPLFDTLRQRTEDDPQLPLWAGPQHVQPKSQNIWNSSLVTKSVLTFINLQTTRFFFFRIYSI